MKHEHKHSLVGSFITGGALIALGVLLLLPAFGYEAIDISWHWRWWPVILIVIGIAQFFEAGNIKKRGEAVWTVFIGCWLLVSFLHVWGLSFSTSWPILIVGVGIGMVWKSILKRNGAYHQQTEVRHEN